MHHDGIRETLNAIRESYWIVRGREAVKQKLRKCVVCKKYEGRPYSIPLTSVLPTDRVADAPPFTNTGVDFAGPLYSKNSHDHTKVYVCIFTCSTTWAVHLELVDSLAVPQFLQAFRRFVGRRGLLAKMISDNAKTFKSASSKIKKISRSTEVQQYLTNKQVSWEFIIEKAPWWGGFWERMVRSVKNCLRKNLGRTSLTFEELRTLLVEIEATINKHPITYIYDDKNGLSYPLTPSKLIYGRQLANSVNGRQFELSSTHSTLSRRANHHTHMLGQFAKQWRK